MDLPKTDPWGIKCGGAYRPLITVFEANSEGEMARIASRLTGRTHHYLSSGEQGYHYVLELNGAVVDIREQYPIVPIEFTLSLAKALKVPHPSRSGKPFEITIDFMVTVDDGVGNLRYVARSFKKADDLADPRILGRQALEYAACMNRSIPWKLVTNHQITGAVLARARWPFRVFKDRPRYAPNQHTIDMFLDALRGQYFDEPLKRILRQVAAQCHIDLEEAQDIFKYLICTRRLKVDLALPLSLKDPHLALIENFR